MPNIDDRLTGELERAATPADPAGAFAEIERRRVRRVQVRRMQTALLATVVFAGSIAGVAVLNHAFRAGTNRVGTSTTDAVNGDIVVSFDDGGGTHLYLLDPSDPTWNTRDHQLTDAGNSAVDQHPSVSPDGTTVAFDRTYLCLGPVYCAPSIWTVGIDGAAPRQLAVSATDPAWSPDGTQIAFVRAEGDASLHLMNADGSDPHAIKLDTQLYDAHDPSWSPDGTKIAFSAFREPSTIEGVRTSAVFEVSVEGDSRVVGVTSDQLPSSSEPAWSPDGSQIAFVRSGEIWVVPLASMPERSLTSFDRSGCGTGSPSDSAPTWSPDGRLIAFERTCGPSEHFTYVMNADATDLHRVGPGGEPAWARTSVKVTETPSPVTIETSPSRITPKDNGLLAYADGATLFTVSPSGGDPTPVDGLPSGAWLPAWSPDGSRLAVAVFPTPPPGATNADPRALWVVNADGSGAMRIAEAENISQPSWSPDGTHIAFAAREASGSTLHIIGADGTGDRVVSDSLPRRDYFSVEFSPDGTELLFDAGTDAGFGIFRLRLDDGSVTQINPTHSDYDPSWSPDGAKVLFTRQEEGAESDIYEMNADGTEVVRLTNDGPGSTNLYPVFSPDGTQIAYLAGVGGGPGALVVMDAGGGHPRTLVKDGVLGIAWQPLPTEG
jgi:Tol biopolymer transport system component